jgi:hypothetical protein
MALVGMSAASLTMTDDERVSLTAIIVGESAGVLREYSDSEGLTFQIGSNVATGRS